MAKMKIYEIAKSLNTKSTDLVKVLNDNGFEVKSHNSNIEDGAIAFLLKSYAPKKEEKPEVKEIINTKKEEKPIEKKIMEETKKEETVKMVEPEKTTVISEKVEIKTVSQESKEESQPTNSQPASTQSTNTQPVNSQPANTQNRNEGSRPYNNNSNGTG
ncbi:MAG: translation initiation factor IF-2 N-terminal domain-containing protein, partial [Acetivibrio sp.]